MIKLRNKVAVIGLGYVGLPLAVAAAKSGYQVVGIDIDAAKLDQINDGSSPVEDILDQELLSVIQTGHFVVSSDFSQVSAAEVVVICVPTPLGDDRKPDLSHINSSVKSFAKHLRGGTLVILESTVQPGTTRNYLVTLIQDHSELTIDNFEIAYSPERIDPLNKVWNLANTPKIVSGLTEKAAKSAVAFYSKFINHLTLCDTPEIAELAKLLENTFRYINISFVNEFSMFCRILGVDIRKVIDAAATKPYGFMPFYPGIGVGGHCIPVDPLYLAQKAQEIGSPSRFIDLADDINLGMPGYFIGRAEEKLGSLKGKHLIVIGVSYKVNVTDVRETPVLSLIQGLQKKGAIVSWHDDLVKEWNGEKSVALSSDFDLAIIATLHDYIDLTKLGSVPVLNTRESI
jgi:UDP-N-acetyl-D-glucosamine dehydrogenase